ncbi:MAG: ABC transporter permease [Bacteroidales bacterium]|nr:ABC transporter permease [Bacteroidales bacterium]
MTNNTSTIIKKEFARFFKDPTLLLTTVVMPGVLIYLVYSLMGTHMMDQFTADDEAHTTLFVSNLPPSLSEPMNAMPYTLVCDGFSSDAMIEQLSNKEFDAAVVVFPDCFDSLCTLASVADDVATPNVQIFYNTANPNSRDAFHAVQACLEAYEQSVCNLFDVNADESVRYDQADEEDTLGDLLSKLVPMLLITLLFSGCMAVAPASIAGEKERGTIATLLVTPMKRRELALGKIVSLSFFALLSGLSSFTGIMLSMPKMMQSEVDGLGMGLYTPVDMLYLLLLILSTVLVLVSFISILSALAKDVKSATTMVSPLMLIVIFVGLTPMFGGNSHPMVSYLVPVLNSVQCMSDVFDFHASLLPVLLTVVANMAWALAAVFVLTRMFDSEKVMFSR